ncbi:hypothetical protein G6F56_001274 [Rhizopus delemar]|nr:hypothetical protein G6F56_001274 [Rhizopus delemar]
MTVSNDNSPNIFTELNRRATVDKSETSKYTLKRWATSVSKLYEKGDLEFLNGNLEEAYILYMKGCSIMVEIIGKHSSIKEFKKDTLYIELKARTVSVVLDRLEHLNQKLQEKENAQKQADEDIVKEAMNRYPPVDSTGLDDLPSVPTHLPGTTPLLPRQNTPPQEMKMPEPHPVSHQVPQPMPQTIPQQMLQQHNKEQRNNIELPTPTHFRLASPTIAVEPKQLASWIVKHGTGPQPSVLLLDVRPRSIHSEGLIRHRWVAQIEPLVVKPDVNSGRIEESMIMNPETEQVMFAGRHQFDMIVCYDQNSKSLRDNSALEHLGRAIYEFEFKKVLQNPPVMLIGGFDAWKSIIGNRGIYSYTQHSPTDQSVPISPVKVHQTFYDYFTYTGPTATRKESMSKYSEKNYVETPPLQGVFANTIAGYSEHKPTQMPVPQPVASTTKYPEIQPNKSDLSRRNTFIDNPFHGFTTTTNKQFDIPPSIKRPVLKDLPPPLPPKPTDINFSEYRTGPVSENSFSQMGHSDVGRTGLKNLGNTCYMNSIIQCLSGTIPFARYFISGLYKQHINKENFLGTKGALANEFSVLLRSIWGANCNFISPVHFREAISQFSPQFQGSEQHDSQEFLNFLLDGLHEDCNLIKKRPPPLVESAEDEARFERLPDWEASKIAWERYLGMNSSVVVSLFQGQYKSQLTCLTCQTTSTTYNAFMSLSLPIPATRNGPSSVDIYQCLDAFVKKEVLEKDDAWHCSHCKKLCRATKTLTISKLPDVLLIHLKRFSFDGPFNNKLETMVNSPIRGLDLSKYVPSSMFSPNHPPEKSTFSYDLYAVSNHYGSLTGGHYTACVRNGYGNEWHNFDDTRLSVCDESKIIGRAAYNLFYVRSTVK